MFYYFHLIKNFKHKNFISNFLKKIIFIIKKYYYYQPKFEFYFIFFLQNLFINLKYFTIFGYFFNNSKN
jgi:hypothetical protein